MMDIAMENLLDAMKRIQTLPAPPMGIRLTPLEHSIIKVLYSAPVASGVPSVQATAQGWGIPAFISDPDTIEREGRWIMEAS